ncbi:protein-glutamate methylesterase/protein-glutamine glutaminase [Anaeromassilibacillus sp. An200]|uniref:protein-glutamate methylesterase/protein-glutamine glutaminase n=1 Tax=Anaeromassilibacillus sp. An200 TaxID=1965587 RepID=UPI000B3AB1E6|nr:chemotaxis response regulator protein-glutamate methylesterase [Anaeromassilibacillus sp. An200]OUP10554.1 chemotaxis response regulator protein-glutamate methylesterase [Anaeromassilibacillus sp. An200]
MFPDKKIRVLVVDDSALARQMIVGGLSKDPNIEVVGYAFNAPDAKSKIELIKPDVVTMDVEMPGMSGIDFLKQYLPKHPIPVILVSSLNLRVFDALEAGAVDFVRKPDAEESKETFFRALRQRIRAASCAHVRHRSTAAAAAPAAPIAPLASGTGALHYPANQTIIGLGASTGGTEATLDVLKRLPADIPGMVVVQHMPVGFTKMYAERLDKICKMEVREAVNGDEIRPGLVLIAPADLQVKVVRMGERYTLSCFPGEKVSGHRPSVDALFSSMASTVKCHMVGIIMTGMGRDGASGLLAMRKAGAYTIGQDRESSVVYGMPMVAHDIGAVTIQASCENIASVLMTHLKTGK